MEWDFNFAVNARGVFLTNQVAARHFVRQSAGVIVNTASLAAKVGAPFLAHYSVSKFAVLGWTQALAR
jgi:meso-butanediol dehydrogenase/(S,S)-butanediol dehydrogenase/diacetyl reductase